MATEDTAYNGSSGTHGISEEEVLITKGPWTEEEDSVLFSYITVHGEGHWNSVARCAGLKRTGKSCRLRWLNYLSPSVRRGNITLQEQLLILELHSRWGNRWSKIAEQIPGRTDNEIKNYWRTRVVKQAKLLKCDVNSKQFRDTMRFVWMPRMVERIKAHEASSSSSNTDQQQQQQNSDPSLLSDQAEHSSISSYSPLAHQYVKEAQCSLSPHSSTESYNINLLGGGGGGCSSYSTTATAEEGSRTTPWHWQQTSYYYSDIQQGNDFGTAADLWTDENICFLQQQLADHDV